MYKFSYQRLAMDLMAMLLALVVGLIFAIINVLITQLILSAWSDLIFGYACPIGVLYNFNLGSAPFIHAFIIGLPLTVLAGCTTAILASRQITRINDALILGGTTGIMSAIVPYGSAWALYALFAIYWVELPLYTAYTGMVLLGVAVFVPPAALGAYYYSREKFKIGSIGRADDPLMTRTSIARIIDQFKIPLIFTMILVLTIALPLAVALVCVRMGWIM